jgi:transposase
MLLQDPNLKVWLYGPDADMRNQFDGLAALVQSSMAMRANNGEVFVFLNRKRKRTMMKALYYSQGGYCLWAKRLERGHFAKLSNNAVQALTWAQLQCVIAGINWQLRPQNKRL